MGMQGDRPGPRRDPPVTPQADGAGLAQRAHELIPGVTGHVPPACARRAAQAVRRFRRHRCRLPRLIPIISMTGDAARHTPPPTTTRRPTAPGPRQRPGGHPAPITARGVRRTAGGDRGGPHRPATPTARAGPGGLRPGRAEPRGTSGGGPGHPDPMRTAAARTRVHASSQPACGARARLASPPYQVKPDSDKALLAAPSSR